LRNMFCDTECISNEASVEAWFVNPLLTYLGYDRTDLRLKTRIQEFRVGKGRKSVNYKPDYIAMVGKMPVLVVDAKHPGESIDKWTEQCSSYCLELNKSFETNPVKYYLLTNAIRTTLYRWDKDKPILELSFADFVPDSPGFQKLTSYISRACLSAVLQAEEKEILDSDFPFTTVSLAAMSKLFQEIHQYIWTEEKKTPSAAFMELIKIVFVKLQKDKELHQRLGRDPRPKTGDVTFSKHWISRQTESQNPVNDPLFKNLLADLEHDISRQKKKRIFDHDSEINLSAHTIEKIVEKLEHIDLFGMDEDVHGRMFEIFLDATVRGKELGQFFTPRDIVKLMVELASPEVRRDGAETVLDACCGSGGFLIASMSHMLDQVRGMAGLSNLERQDLEEKVRDSSLYGIDAGSDPPIYRIARMNMYLHGDGGSNIFFADSLDKRIGTVGPGSVEYDLEISELRRLLVEKKMRFDVVLSNPPFSLKYSRDNRDQKEIMDQYDLVFHRGRQKPLKSLLSSVMFLERYLDLVEPDGRILAIIDDSVLSGDAYAFVRDFIRDKFIIRGVISLPGDAFRRAAARVKTSVLVLRPKKVGEVQPDIFMACSIYLGLSEKTARRIGIPKDELEKGKQEEIQTIVRNYKAFLAGVPGPHVVPASRCTDRLDVKYCTSSPGRKKHLWIARGYDVATLGTVLRPASARGVDVKPDDEYPMLKVNYHGDVLDAETKSGDECSYARLYKVEAWDILCSNMGLGRGAVGIVPPYHEGKFVSNEYTILRANTEEEALYYTGILRTKELMGEILVSTTGMNRGRMKWGVMRNLEVPKYNPELHSVKDDVAKITSLWASYETYMQAKRAATRSLATSLDLETEDARKRWLAFKPPE
jgi:type I restriction enzyme M protein